MVLFFYIPLPTCVTFHIKGLYFVHLRSLISLLPSPDSMSSFTHLYSRPAPDPLELCQCVMLRSLEPSCSLCPSPEPTSFLHPTLEPRSSPRPGAYELLPLEPGGPSQLSPSRHLDISATELPSTGQESLSSPVSA